MRPTLALAAALVLAAPLAAEAQALTHGAIEIADPFTRASLPNARAAAGYLRLTNHGEVPDRLVGVAAPWAERGETHRMAMSGEVAIMEELPEGIAIGVHETVELAPGGLHLMFLGLAAPLVEGECAPVTLTFEIAGEVDLCLPVRDATATSAGQSAGAHAGH